MSAMDNIEQNIWIECEGRDGWFRDSSGDHYLPYDGIHIAGNPAMLSVARTPFDDALFATAIAAFVGCIVMGLWANLPFACLGLGLNAYFTFAVVLGWASHGKSLSRSS